MSKVASGMENLNRNLLCERVVARLLGLIRGSALNSGPCPGGLKVVAELGSSVGKVRAGEPACVQAGSGYTVQCSGLKAPRLLAKWHKPVYLILHLYCFVFIQAINTS